MEGIEKGSMDPAVASEMMSLLLGPPAGERVDREMAEWFELARKSIRAVSIRTIAA